MAESDSSAAISAHQLNRWYGDYKPTFSASFAQIAGLNIERHLVPFFGKLRVPELEERHLLQFIIEKTKGKRPL